MAGIREKYRRRVGEIETERRLYIGLGLVGFGVFLVLLGGIISVSETVGGLFGASNPTEQWGIGGIFAGIGVPVTFLGIFTVLPASWEDRRIALVGVGTSFVGILVFTYVYPHMWHGDPTDLTWTVVLVYGGGSVIEFLALFKSILDLELRIELSSPGKPISVGYSDEDEGEPVKSAASTTDDSGSGGFGSMAVSDMSSTSLSTSLSSSTSGGGGSGGGGRGDGTDAEILGDDTSATETEPEFESPAQEPRSLDNVPTDSGFTGDRYCGNCIYLEYVEDGGTSSPYCDYHETKLDDLEPCEAHTVKMSGGKGKEDFER
ncbi:MAG: hypothetical protein SV253_10040 [Halobacteria archaeon]|nr:hypothetical protein [Halobacteria archaeon]